MNVILGLDTADRTAGAAVVVDGTVRAAKVERAPARHSVRLFALINGVLDAAGLSRSALTGICVTRGPGSFTGLRVGMATAKGIAFALGLPVAGVSTLETLARPAMPFDGLVIPLLDAKKAQVYGAAFDGRSGAAVIAEAAWSPEGLAGELQGLERDCLLVGSGLAPFAETFASFLGCRFQAAPEEAWAIQPAEVARLGAVDLACGRGVLPAALTPTYCRLSEAEEKKRKRAD